MVLVFVPLSWPLSPFIVFADSVPWLAARQFSAHNRKKGVLMTDFEYDVKQKKEIARSAFAKKNGSKSKYCSLPSDHMTEAQWKKRNGLIMSYDLKKPMNWTQFTTMPPDIQEEYLRGLSERYHVTIRCLSDLFGVSWDTVRRHIKINHPWMKFKRGFQMSDQDKAGFAEFLCGEGCDTVVLGDRPIEEKSEVQETIGESIKKILPKKEPVVEKSRFHMRKLVTEFEDIYDANAIQNMIRAILPTGLAGLPVSVKIEINVLDS